MTDTPPTDDEREGLAMAVSTRTFAFFDGDEDCGDWPEMSERARNIYREAADAALAYLAPIRAREIAAAEARGAAEERARVVAWLRSLPHYANLANQIERREHAQEAGNERNHG